jgi:molybdenum cofactor biosynthesis enzyme MoaA
VYCNVWKLQTEDPGIKEKELTPHEIRGVLEASRGFLNRVRSVSIMGGEPFLRGDLGEIVNTIVSFLPRVTIRINTNGFLTERILNRES